MPLFLILIATTFMALSGLAGLFGARQSSWGERVFVTMVTLGAVAGLVGSALGLRAETAGSLSLPLPLVGQSVALTLDVLSAFFLIPIFLVGGLGAVYGLAYWRQADHPENGRRLRLFWGLLIAGMIVLVLAANALVFLFGWEVMALSAFLLIATEDDQSEVRATSWLYLVTTHFGTLCLFAMFGLLRQAAGSFELKPVALGQSSLGLLTVIFFLAVVGFGLKAGMMPLHFWLPSAHANAPSHVSAIMSGVLIKMGIYGLVRITSLLPEPPVAWGSLLLILGAGSGVLGVLFAIGQHDLKRLLAYHSVENIGIILMGLGLAMVGRSIGRIDFIVLGMAGCLLHVWNHGLFKSLLFLSAGSVIHAGHTRRIDRMGGLAKSMPWTASMFLLGAVAICGLPPLNGFISELLIYLGLMRSMAGGSHSWPVAALAVPVLAIIGALAVACFVKAYGAVFLGLPRSSAPRTAHESSRIMIGPMVVIAGCCVLIGLAPVTVIPILNRGVESWARQTVGADMQLASLIPLAWISAMGIVLLSTVWISYYFLQRWRVRDANRRGTWDCGYAQPTARMQYTASSFAAMIVGLFRWFLHPRKHRPELRELFASASRFESHVDDVVLERQIMPTVRTAAIWLARFRGLQQGLTQHYVLYILVTIVALLAWTMPISQIVIRMFAR